MEDEWNGEERNHQGSNIKNKKGMQSGKEDEVYEGNRVFGQEFT